MARLKVQMISLRQPPSRLPSELIANGSIREEPDGDPTNNLHLEGIYRNFVLVKCKMDSGVNLQV